MNHSTTSKISDYIVPHFESDNDFLNYIRKLITEHYSPQKAGAMKALLEKGVSYSDISKNMHIPTSREGIDNLINRYEKGAK